MNASEITAKIMAMYNSSTINVDAIVDEMYDENAVFSDPIVEVHGRDKIAAQFRFLSVMFHSSDAKVQRGSVSGSSIISIESVVQGSFRPLPQYFGCSFRMFTVLEFKNSKIISHTDHWDLRSVVENFPLISTIYPKFRYVLGNSSSQMVNALMPRHTTLPRELLQFEETKSIE